MEMHRIPSICVMGILSLLFAACSKTPSNEPKGKPAEAGRALRHLMLTTPAEKFGLKPTEAFPRVFGVLLDWPIGQETATIFASSSGAASLYTTSTFGIIGGEQHASVRTAATNLVRACDRLIASSHPTTEYPYPGKDHVRFYLLTFDGVRVLETDLASVEQGRSQYGDVFDLGQAVLTQLRRITENP